MPKIVAVGLREKEVDHLYAREFRNPLYLAWSARHAASHVRQSSQAFGQPVRRSVTPEDLFIALDGRSVAAAKGRFRVEVFSVRDEAGSRWIQLALNGPESQVMLSVRARPGDGPHHVIHTLTAFLNDPEGTRDVFNVNVA